MPKAPISIVDAMHDPQLFGPFYQNDLTTWKRWLVLLKCVFGIPVRSAWGKKLVKECTGRDASKMPSDGFQTSLLLVGRRSGKSRTAATIVSYMAALAGLESRLAPGEAGLVACIAPTKLQTKIVRGYIRSLLSSPMLEQEIVRERSQDTFQLRSGIRLELLASDYRSTRGFSLVGCVIDDVCFLGDPDRSRTRAAGTLVQAVLPSLATTNGKLVCISSPYSKSGWPYETYKKHYGNDASQDVLVWNAPSKVMNPTLSQRIIDRAMAEDRSAALSEYGAQWREDVGAFVSIELLEALVVKGRKEHFAMPGVQYHAYVDISGGRGDASAMCISHKDGKTIIVDSLVHAPSPHSPFAAIANMAQKLREYGISRVTGDAYSGEFVSRAFQDHGIAYQKSPKNASDLYKELLPILVNGDIELLDWPRAVKQLANLERRAGSNGKEIITHPTKLNDDIANVIAGAAFLANAKKITIGTIFRDSTPRQFGVLT